MESHKFYHLFLEKKVSNWYKKASPDERYFMGTLYFKVFVPRTESFETDRSVASETVHKIGLDLIKQGIDVTNSDVTSMGT